MEMIQETSVKDLSWKNTRKALYMYRPFTISTCADKSYSVLCFAMYTVTPCYVMVMFGAGLVAGGSIVDEPGGEEFWFWSVCCAVSACRHQFFVLLTELAACYWLALFAGKYTWIAAKYWTPIAMFSFCNDFKCPVYFKRLFKMLRYNVVSAWMQGHRGDNLIEVQESSFRRHPQSLYNLQLQDRQRSDRWVGISLCQNNECGGF